MRLFIPQTGVSTRSLFVRARRRGNTLIELLVVIAIIGILISMLLPSMHRSLRMAATTVCMHNLRSVGQALALYRVENNGWLPTQRAVAASALAAASGSQNSAWFGKLFPTYMNDPMVLTCPEDPYRGRMAKAKFNLSDPAIADYPSYGLNGFIMSAAGGVLADLDRHRPSRPLETIMVADLGPDHAGRIARAPQKGLYGPKRNQSFLSWDDGYDPFSGSSDPWLTMRHGVGINMLTIDGGVHPARTMDVIQTPIRSFYYECLAGGCSLCAQGGGGSPDSPSNYITHYSFARNALYWWTGPLVLEPSPSP